MYTIYISKIYTNLVIHTNFYINMYMITELEGFFLTTYSDPSSLARASLSFF